MLSRDVAAGMPGEIRSTAVISTIFNGEVAY
jgi:hypothetical protein